MKEQQTNQKTNQKEEKRVSIRFYLKADDNSKIEELMQTLKKRGWKREKMRLIDLIIDELFLKADNKFFEGILSRLTPLEYLFKTKMDNPAVRKEMEKILKRKG